jgi:hypothetical protein
MDALCELIHIHLQCAQRINEIKSVARFAHFLKQFSYVHMRQDLLLGDAFF